LYESQRVETDSFSEKETITTVKVLASSYMTESDQK